MKNNESKKQRACDNCRVRKIKCDGPQRSQEGLKCTGCESSNKDCTYVKPAVPKTYISKGYSEALENRIERLEALIQKLNPGYDYIKEIGPPISTLTFKNNESNKRKGPESDETIPTSHSQSQTAVNNECDDPDVDELEEKMRCFFLGNPNPDLNRYFGSSSSSMLLTVANHYSNNNKSKSEPYDKDLLRHDFWQDSELVAEEKSLNNNLPLFPQDFPENDLLEHLVESYFNNVNYTFPLLHKPTFLENLKSKKFQWDFSGVVLLICAIGSQYSDDARVLSDKKDPRFAGENFYKTFKLKCFRKSLFSSPSIEEIQSLILLQVYFQSMSPHSKAGWSINGYAIALCEDVGFHRQCIAVYDNAGIFNELRSRVFWCAFLLDISGSSMFGKRTILNEDFFDLDLPNLLPDEFGTKTEISIKYFREFNKLYNIQSQVLRTLNPLKKKKENAVKTTENVAYLNSKLVDWNQNLEPKLRHNPACSDRLTYILSSYLRIAFHLVQIQIYRQFLTLNRRVNSYRTTSMSICTSAAMSILQIWSTLSERLDKIYYSDPMVSFSPFTAAIVMVISACESRKYASGSQTHLPELKYIEFALNIFKRRESREIVSGKAVDILTQLINSSSLSVKPTQLNDVDPLSKLCEDMKYEKETTLAMFSNEASQQNQQFYLDTLNMMKIENDVKNSKQVNDGIMKLDNLFQFNDDNIIDTEWNEFLNNIFNQSVYNGI